MSYLNPLFCKKRRLYGAVIHGAVQDRQILLRGEVSSPLAKVEGGI